MAEPKPSMVLALDIILNKRTVEEASRLIEAFARGAMADAEQRGREAGIWEAAKICDRPHATRDYNEMDQARDAILALLKETDDEAK